MYFFHRCEITKLVLLKHEITVKKCILALKIYNLIFLYNILLNITGFALKFVALFNHKIKLGVEGRKQTFKLLNEGLSSKDKTIWLHCASLGEYEQIKPILKSLSENLSTIKKIVTFFSPSGYENMGESRDVDLKIYLPVDSLHSITILLNQLKPSLFVISKHDIWPNLVWSLYNRKIPAFLINGTMPADSYMTKPFIRNFYRSVFSCFSFIAPANAKDKTVPYWSQPYKILFQTFPGITASMQAKSGVEGEYNIVQYDILLSDITKFTRELAFSENGKVFILSEELDVLGLPKLEKFQNPDTLIKYAMIPYDSVSYEPLTVSVNEWKELPSGSATPVHFFSGGEK